MLNHRKAEDIMAETSLIPLEKILEHINRYTHETLLKSKVTISRFEEITPEIAKYYLTLMVPKAPGKEANRRLTQSRVNELSEEMGLGRFRKIHQGIAFDKDGRLIDGQHRLHAIVKSGKTVFVMVTYGIDSEAWVNIDQNRPRTAPDMLHMDGVKNSSHRCAIASRIHCGIKRGKGTHTVAEPKLKLHEKHSEAMDFVLANLAKKSRGIGSAPVLSILCRAYYTQDRDKLQLFMRILNNGVSPEGCEIDHSILQEVVRLRDHLLNYGKGRKKGQSGDMLDEYADTQMVLWAFLNNHTGKLKKLMETTVFPIPEESHYPEVLGYSLDGRHLDHGGCGNGIWESEKTSKTEISAFASAWYKTYGNNGINTTELLDFALANGFFTYLQSLPTSNGKSCRLSKGVLMPLHGNRRGTKEHYWLRITVGKKASWRIFTK